MGGGIAAVDMAVLQLVLRIFGAIRAHGELNVLTMIFNIAPQQNKCVPDDLKLAFLRGKKI